MIIQSSIAKLESPLLWEQLVETGTRCIRLNDSNVYAIISPQMGKQVVAFLAAMEIKAEQFSEAFSGYSLEVMESHQAGNLDTSGSAMAVISCFQKLGLSFETDQTAGHRANRHFKVEEQAADLGLRSIICF